MSTRMCVGPYLLAGAYETGERLALIDGICNGFTAVSFVESLVPDEPRLKLQGVADRGAAAAAPSDNASGI